MLALVQLSLAEVLAQLSLVEVFVLYTSMYEFRYRNRNNLPTYYMLHYLGHRILLDKVIAHILRLHSLDIPN